MRGNKDRKREKEENKTRKEKKKNDNKLRSILSAECSFRSFYTRYVSIQLQQAIPHLLSINLRIPLSKTYKATITVSQFFPAPNSFDTEFGHIHSTVPRKSVINFLINRSAQGKLLTISFMRVSYSQHQKISGTSL